MTRLIACAVCAAIFYAVSPNRKHCSADCLSRTRLKAQPEDN
jgi:hypothetical protein